MASLLMVGRFIISSPATTSPIVAFVVCNSTAGAALTSTRVAVEPTSSATSTV